MKATDRRRSKCWSPSAKNCMLIVCADHLTSETITLIRKQVMDLFICLMYKIQLQSMMDNQLVTAPTQLV